MINTFHWNQPTLQIFTVRNNENTTLLNSDDNQLVVVSPVQAAWLSRWLKIQHVLSTEGPRMTQILGLGKGRVKRSKLLSFWLHQVLRSQFMHYIHAYLYWTDINPKTLFYAKCKDNAQEGEPRHKILHCIVLVFIWVLLQYIMEQFNKSIALKYIE